MDPNATYDALKRAFVTAKATPFMEPGIDDVITDLSEKFYALDNWLQTGGFLPDAWMRTHYNRDLTTAEQLANEAVRHFPSETVKAIKWWRHEMGGLTNTWPSLKEARDMIYKAKGLPT